MFTSHGHILPQSAAKALESGWTFRGVFDPSNATEERLRTYWWNQDLDAIETTFTRKGKTLPRGSHAIWTKPMYYVQCLRGHVNMALPESDLEKRCIERHEVKGRLDAMPIIPGECSKCIAESMINPHLNLSRAAQRRDRLVLIIFYSK